MNKQTDNRLRQQLVDSVTGEPVSSENKGRGYEIGKDQFLMVEDEELEAIQVEGTHTIEIDSFVPRDQIDERYLDSAYYIAPTDKIGQEAFAVIREAMRDKKMAGIGRVVIARRERPIMLKSFGKGILGTTLRYHWGADRPDRAPLKSRKRLGRRSVAYAIGPLAMGQCRRC